MKLLKVGHEIELRPENEKDRKVLFELLGHGGCALLESFGDQTGFYVRSIPMNPDTMSPWKIENASTDMGHGGGRDD